jgi:hypothetical protein
MAKTNFSGPITTGPIQVNTGTTVGTNVRNVGFVLNKAAFFFDKDNFILTTDANKLAVTGSNGASTTSVTLLDTTANVPGLSSDGGFEAASVITMTSAGNDSALTATITGTDVIGNSQTEDVTMANAGVATSTKTFKTVTAIDVSGAGTVGTLEVGVIETGLISWACRSLFNEYPLGQTSTTVNKNLANNIVIPAWSRITNIELINTTAWDTAGFDAQVGGNVAQASGATLNSMDLDYFAGDGDNDVKAVGNQHIPAYFDQSTAQAKNCLNVSDDDASGYEIDKVVVFSAKTDDTLTAGDGVLLVEWLQKQNATN